MLNLREFPFSLQLPADVRNASALSLCALGGVSCTFPACGKERTPSRLITVSEMPLLFLKNTQHFAVIRAHVRKRPAVAAGSKELTAAASRGLPFSCWLHSSSSAVVCFIPAGWVLPFVGPYVGRRSVVSNMNRCGKRVPCRSPRPLRHFLERPWLPRGAPRSGGPSDTRSQTWLRALGRADLHACLSGYGAEAEWATSSNLIFLLCLKTRLREVTHSGQCCLSNTSY